jgi:AsmA protein
MKTVAMAVVGVLIVIVGGVAIFVSTFDAKSYVGLAVDRVKQATGRDLKIAGSVDLRIFPLPYLSVADVSFSNHADGSRPHMASLKKLEVEVALMPLLTGSVEVKRLVLVEPDILLETDAKGRGNWEFGDKPSSSASAPAAGSAGPAKLPRFDLVRLEKATVTYRDGRANRVEILKVDRLDASLRGAGEPLEVDLKADYNERAIELKGKLPSLDQLTGGKALPADLKLAVAGKGREPVKAEFSGTVDGAQSSGAGRLVVTAKTLTDILAAVPVAIDLPFKLPEAGPVAFEFKGTGSPEKIAAEALKLQIADTKLDYAGSIGAKTHAVQGTLSLMAKSVAELGKLAGQSLPDIGPVELSTKLDASQKSVTVDGLKARAGETRLEASGTVTPADLGVSGSLSLTSPSLTELGKLAGQSLPGSGAVNVALKANRSGNTVNLDQIQAKLGNNDLGGRGGMTLGGPRPKVVADFKSSRIALAELLPPSPTAAKPSSPPARPADGRVLPNDPLPFGLLKAADAQVKLSVTEFSNADLVLKDVVVQVNLAEGTLKIDELAAVFADGRLKATGTIDARQANATRLSLNGESKGLDLGRVLRDFQITDAVTAKSDARFRLDGTGTSIRAIAASLDGQVVIDVGDGTLKNKYLDLLAGDIVGKVLPWAQKQEDAKLNCILLRTDIQKGMAEAKVVLMDTSNASFTSTGKIDLKDEKLDLRVVPQPKQASLLSAAPPIVVGGTFASPSVLPDAAALARGAVGAVAGVVGAPAAGIGAVVGAIAGGTTGAATGKGDAPSCADARVAMNDPAARMPQRPAPSAAPPAGQAAPPAASQTPAQPPAQGGNPLQQIPGIGNIFRR